MSRAKTRPNDLWYAYPATPLPNLRHKTIIEIGPGRGDFLFHTAANEPGSALIAIEIKYQRVDKLIARAERRGLKNVQIIQDDARRALPRMPSAFADELHIQFPDPWPKRRHSKHRAVNVALLMECARVLKTGGSIFIATDDQGYAKEIARNASRVPSIKSFYPEIFIREAPEAFPTFFAAKWRAMGRDITYQKYVKV